MRVLCLMLFLAAITVGAPATEVAGAWKAVFVGAQSEIPKVPRTIIFDLRVTGGKLTGVAHMDNWPGDGPLIDGAIVDDRVSFTVFGNSPWRASGPMGAASGLPKLTFSGTVQGSEMRLTVVWDSVMLYGDRPAPKELHLSGKKVSDL
jgi:hypothetical protein